MQAAEEPQSVIFIDTRTKHQLDHVGTQAILTFSHRYLVHSHMCAAEVGRMLAVRQ